eukprot:2765081-Amphidinium_carterae.1
MPAGHLCMRSHTRACWTGGNQAGQTRPRRTKHSSHAGLVCQRWEAGAACAWHVASREDGKCISREVVPLAFFEACPVSRYVHLIAMSEESKGGRWASVFGAGGRGKVPFQHMS